MVDMVDKSIEIRELKSKIQNLSKSDFGVSDKGNLCVILNKEWHLILLNGNRIQNRKPSKKLSLFISKTDFEFKSLDDEDVLDKILTIIHDGED